MSDIARVIVKMPKLRLAIGIPLLVLASWIVPYQWRDAVVSALAGWVSRGLRLVDRSN